MAAILPNVRDTIEALSPSGAMNAPKFTTMSMRQTINCYYLPTSATDRQRRAVMAILTMCGRSNDDLPSKWQSWVITWSCICFPELVQTLRENHAMVDYHYEEFSPGFLDECISAIMAQGNEDTAGKTFVTLPPGLPNVTLLPVTPELASSSTVEGLYAYYAMVVFIAGKSIGPENVQAISTRRPMAIIRKRDLQISEYILVGDGKMSSDNYKKIQGGWVRSTQPRIVIIKHLAVLAAADNRSEILDPIKVNMDMLRNAGQSYIFYIQELLISCDWCIDIPALRAAYYHYSKMVHVLTSQPVYLQPYYKLMMMDQTREVRRKDIEALIAVATFFAAQTRRTMRQYRVNEDTRSAVLAFQEMARQRGLTMDDISNQATTESSVV